MFHAQELQDHFANSESCCISLGSGHLFIIFPVYFGHPVACFCKVSDDEEDVGPVKCS